MRVRIVGSLTAVAMVTACAAGPAPRSGFLRDYRGLSQADKSGSLLEQRPPAGFDLAAYRAVMIEPTDVRTGDLSPEDRSKLAAAFHDTLVERLDGQLPVVATAGPGTLRVRSAIIDARKANVAANVLTSVVGAPLSRGSIAAEAEVVDGGTGRRIAALSWARKGAKLGKIGLSYSRLGEARSGLRDFASRLAGLFTPPPPRG